MSGEPQTGRSDAVDRALSLIEELARVPHQDLRYQLDKLRGYRDALFEHFAPFRVGDQVRLHRNVQIKPSSGWRGYEHMMQTGALAEVVEMDWLRSQPRDGGDGLFSMTVVFDREFRDSKWGADTSRTYVVEPDKRHSFMFWDPARDWELA